ncbi:MAG: hypothetical protein MHM6MM_001143 [Cercozoa sp. M6MM]
MKMILSRLPVECFRGRSRIRLVSGACARSHPAKAHLCPEDSGSVPGLASGGEDALFVSPRRIGVADGVGGYSAKNGRPLDVMNFSRQLCRGMLDSDRHDLRDVLKEAYAGQFGDGSIQ